MTVDGIKAANTSGTWSGNAYTINGVTFTILTDDGDNVTGIKVNGTATGNIYFRVSRYNSSAGTFILNGCPSGGGNSGTYNVYDDDGNGFVDVGNGTQAVTLASGTRLSIYIQIFSGHTASNLIFYPMIRLATETDPTFAPYTNICPISGYDSVSVDDVGFNVFDDVIEIGSINASGQNYEVSSGQYWRSKNYIPVKPNESYYKKLSDGYTTNNSNTSLYYYDKNKNYLFGEANRGNLVTTMPSGCYYVRFVEYFVTERLVPPQKICLNVDTPTGTPKNGDYEPYHSSNATIQFGQTVYGGSVDFLTGVLTVDKGFDTFDGSSDENWIWYGIGSASSYACYIEISPNANVSVRPKSNYATGLIQTDTYGNYDCFVVASSANILIAGKRDKTSVADWKAFLASNPLQVCYELATPFTIQLTPDELKLLKGTNNLTTNGTTITLGYQPDNVIGEVKGEIEKCAVDAEFMQFSDGTDTFTDVNLSLDASFHAVSVADSKIEQKRFICFEVMDKMGGVLQGILASGIAFTDGAKTPSGTAFRAYIDSLQMYVNFRIYDSGGSYTLAYQSETSFSASAFYVRVRLMNNL